MVQTSYHNIASKRLVTESIHDPISKHVRDLGPVGQSGTLIFQLGKEPYSSVRSVKQSEAFMVWDLEPDQS